MAHVTEKGETIKEAPCPRCGCEHVAPGHIVAGVLNPRCFRCRLHTQDYELYREAFNKGAEKVERENQQLQERVERMERAIVKAFSKTQPVDNKFAQRLDAVREILRPFVDALEALSKVTP